MEVINSDISMRRRIKNRAHIKSLEKCYAETTGSGKGSTYTLQEKFLTKKVGTIMNEHFERKSSFRFSFRTKASGGKLVLPPRPSLLAAEPGNQEGCFLGKQSGGKCLLHCYPLAEGGNLDVNEFTRGKKSVGKPVLPFYDSITTEGENFNANKHNARKQSGGKLLLPPHPSWLVQRDQFTEEKHQSAQGSSRKRIRTHPLAAYAEEECLPMEAHNCVKDLARKHTNVNHIVTAGREFSNKRQRLAKKITTCGIGKSIRKLPSHVTKRLSDDGCFRLSPLEHTASPGTMEISHFEHIENPATQEIGHLGPFMKFPPASVRVTQPILFEPWKESKEKVKILFWAFRFLYMFSDLIKLCPFTMDQFVQAFHDFDSKLLGKIHISLLEILLRDLEHAIQSSSNAYQMNHASPVYKSSSFSRLVLSIKSGSFDVKDWQGFLNPLTWPEILRQVLIEAGFGSGQTVDVHGSRKAVTQKEEMQAGSHGLIRGTLKYALFRILRKKGIDGLKINEIAQQVQKRNLRDLPSGARLEELLCLSLSSDITLFERISNSAFRVRANFLHLGEQEDDTCSTSSVDTERSSKDSDSEEHMDSESEEYNAAHSQGTLRYIPLKNDENIFRSMRVRSTSNNHSLNKYSMGIPEIDESQVGDAWVMGLMEGDYTKLSIKEKLITLAALINLVKSGSSMQKATKKPSNHDSKKGKGTFPYVQLSDADRNVKNISNKHRRDRSQTHTCNHSQQESFVSMCLGADRRGNLYWQFFCNEVKDYGYGRVYLESSEDGHWVVLDTEEALETLMALLDPMDVTEANLLFSLQHRESTIRQGMRKLKSERDFLSRESSSGTSAVDNNSECTVSDMAQSSGAFFVESRKYESGMHRNCDDSLEFHKWVWSDFYQKLKISNFKAERLQHCRVCNDLFWPEEGHCIICHTTFELDFDSEERYAVHIAKCKRRGSAVVSQMYKILPSSIQALKAAMQAIEAVLPQEALEPLWKKSHQNVWIKHLRRASSPSDLVQVVTDLESAIRDDWLHASISKMRSKTTCEELIPFSPSMPQTTASIAFWLVRLDAFISLCLKDKGSKKNHRRRQSLRC